MQLHIDRAVQAQTGLLGGDKGATFTLTARLEVDEMEAAIIDRFRMNNQAVTKRLVNGVEIDGETIGSLRDGSITTHASLDALMEFEEILVASFGHLEDLLSYGSQFDENRTVGASGVPIAAAH